MLLWAHLPPVRCLRLSTEAGPSRGPQNAELWARLPFYAFTYEPFEQRLLAALLTHIALAGQTHTNKPFTSVAREMTIVLSVSKRSGYYCYTNISQRPFKKLLKRGACGDGSKAIVRQGVWQPGIPLSTEQTVWQRERGYWRSSCLLFLFFTPTFFLTPFFPATGVGSLYSVLVLCGLSAHCHVEVSWCEFVWRVCCWLWPGQDKTAGEGGSVKKGC